MLNKINPFIKNRDEFYSFYWNLLVQIIGTEEELLKHNRDISTSKKNFLFLYDNFKKGIFQNHTDEGDELFSYVPLNFFLGYSFHYNFIYYIKTSIAEHYNQILNIIHETYYLNHDRLLEKYISDFILSFKVIESVITELNNDAELFKKDLLNDEIKLDKKFRRFPISRHFINKDSSLKQLCELKKYINKVSYSLNNQNLDKYLNPIDLTDEIEPYLRKVEHLDFYTKNFCAYLLYFLNSNKNKITSLLINDLNLPFINNKLIEADTFEIKTNKLLNRCFISQKTFNVFLINYIKNDDITLSELSLAFQMLKQSNQILPINEKFFIDEMFKHNEKLKNIFQYSNRFYRNSERAKPVFKEKFEKLFNKKNP